MQKFYTEENFFCAFCNFFATFLQFFCNFFAIFLHFFAIFLQIFCKFFAKNVQKFFQKKKRTRGHESIIQQPLLEVTRKWIPFVLIPNQFTKILQKNCKKIAKKLQKFCRFFAEFLQLHILQKVLHFRPREESVRSLIKIFLLELRGPDLQPISSWIFWNCQILPKIRYVEWQNRVLHYLSWNNDDFHLIIGSIERWRHNLLKLSAKKF